MIKRSIHLIMVIVFITLIFNTVPINAITGSMGNAKMILRPEVNGWTDTIIEKSILVKNVNNESINITLEVDEDGKDFLELIDTEFVLEPGENFSAQFLVKVKKVGSYNGKINVFFTPYDGEGAGVALTSNIIVIAEKETKYVEEEEETEEENEEENETESVNVALGGKPQIDEEKDNFSFSFPLIFTLILFGVLGGLLFVAKKRGKLNAKEIDKAE